MSEPKTARNRASVRAFLDGVEDPERRRDAKTVDRMMRAVSGEKPAMWGTSIVGYGTYTKTYADGKQRDWMRMGFSPRKQSLVLYIMDGFRGRAALLRKLGPHKTGKACLYVKRLEQVDLEVLEQLMTASYAAKGS